VCGKHSEPAGPSAGRRGSLVLVLSIQRPDKELKVRWFLRLRQRLARRRSGYTTLSKTASGKGSVGASVFHWFLARCRVVVSIRVRRHKIAFTAGGAGTSIGADCDLPRAWRLEPGARAIRISASPCDLARIPAVRLWMATVEPVAAHLGDGQGGRRFERDRERASSEHGGNAPLGADESRDGANLAGTQ
jgi:hypothetical protein